MGFYLRGGRPKNMGQGAYWVQRHLADQRRHTASQEAALRFNNRYRRIGENFERVFLSIAGETLTMEVDRGARLSEAVGRYYQQKATIDHNIVSADQADLSKLTTSARRILAEVAKVKGWSCRWDASAKTLRIYNMVLDFS